MLPPGVPPQAFFGMPPSTIPSQSQSGINYTIAYDDSGASTRLRRARLSFFENQRARLLRPPLDDPGTPRSPPFPELHPQTSARISSTTLRTMPRTPPVPPPPLPGTPPGTRVLTPTSPTTLSSAIRTTRTAAPPRASPRRDSNASAKRSSPMP